jgi:hypothetical protein
VQVVVVTYVRDARGGAPDRVHGLISAFQARGDDVTTFDLPVRKPVYAPRHLPLWYLRPSTKWRRDAERIFRSADIVVASLLGAAHACLAVSHERLGYTLIYDAHNDECRLAFQTMSPRMARQVCRMEDRVVTGVDVVWAAGALDTLSLSTRHPGAHIINLPNGVGDMPDLGSQTIDPARLFTYGSWTYGPNVAALGVLASTPTLALGTFTVFGTLDARLRSQLEAQAAASQPNLRWHFPGYEQDWTKMAGTGAVALIPLWSGGGTKLRVVQLAAMGVPMVATPEAVSGLPEWFRREVALAATPDALIATAMAYDQPSAASRRRLQRRVRSELSWRSLLQQALESSGLGDGTQ